MGWFSNFTLGGLLGRFPEIIREVKDRYGVVALVALLVGVALVSIAIRNAHPVLVGIVFVYGSSLLIGMAVLIYKIDTELRNRLIHTHTTYEPVAGPSLDVAIMVERDLMQLPEARSPSTERAAIELAKRFFERQFFYASDEKDVSSGLWAVAKTRLAWEQQVTTRVTDSSKPLADKVTMQLLALQDFHQNLLQTPNGLVNRAIIMHSNDKAAFLSEIANSRVLMTGHNRIISGTAEEKERYRLLGALRAALSKLGIKINPTKRPPFPVQPGGE